MKINELVGIKNQVKQLPKPTGTFDMPFGVDWNKMLASYGFKPIGQGAFGIVWENPKLPYVLKVFSADDKAYIDWVATAQKYQNNPHMPKFISTKVLTITPEVRAIRIEKLSRTPAKFNRVINQSLQMLRGAERDKFTRSEGSLKGYCEQNPQWLAALNVVRKFIQQTDHTLDFNAYNVMIRGADTLVITDPVLDRPAQRKRIDIQRAENEARQKAFQAWKERQIALSRQQRK